MLKRALIIITLMLTMPLHAHSSDNDILGVWKTGVKNGSWGYIRFTKCGGKYCGTLINGAGKKVDRTMFGTKIVKDMAKNGPRYSGGEIFDAEAGIWYLSKMQLLSKNRLKVSGCVLGGLICGGQIWQRQ